MPTNSSKASGRMAVWSFDRQPAVKRARVPRTLLTYGPPILPCQAEPTAFGPGFAQARVRVWQVAPMVGKESVFIGRRQETGQLSVKCLVSLRLSLKGNKGVLEKQGAGLGVLELQFGQLNEILTERGDPARLEVHELLFGGVREALEALAAQLLAALCWPYFSVPSPSFVQCLVSILVVSQCPKPPVQQVLGCL